MAEQREEAKRQFDADMGPALQELANLRLVLDDRAKGKKPVVGKKDVVQAGAKEKKKKSALGGLFGKKK
jgi:hypothetical protein